MLDIGALRGSSLEKVTWNLEATGKFTSSWCSLAPYGSHSDFPQKKNIWKTIAPMEVSHFGWEAE